MSVLLTGGAGYIGSHITLELLRKGEQIIIIDNLSNSTMRNIDILSVQYPGCITMYNVDLTDYRRLAQIFEDTIQSNQSIKCVIHLAGLKSVKESVVDPLKYYHNNVTGTINLLRAMKQYKCSNLIFSSSATVYGLADQVPIEEDAKICPINAYGRTKVMIEDIIGDMVKSDAGLKNVISLRYFNPVGRDELLREEAVKDLPENLFPYLLKVIKGELNELTVFGNDYPTSDGTPVRDYIHVVDLAQAHIAALNHITKSTSPSTSTSVTHQIINIGTGQGYTVLDIIRTFDELGYPIKYKLGPRREGDAAISYASTTRAKEILGWTSKKTLLEMCKDSVY